MEKIRYFLVFNLPRQNEWLTFISLRVINGYDNCIKGLLTVNCFGHENDIAALSCRMAFQAHFFQRTNKIYTYFGPFEFIHPGLRIIHSFIHISMGFFHVKMCIFFNLSVVLCDIQSWSGWTKKTSHRKGKIGCRKKDAQFARSFYTLDSKVFALGWRCKIKTIESRIMNSCSYTHVQHYCLIATWKEWTLRRLCILYLREVPIKNHVCHI